MRQLVLYPRVWELVNFPQLQVKTDFRKNTGGSVQQMSSGPHVGGEAEQCRDVERWSLRGWVWRHFHVGCWFAQEGLPWVVR